jgi:inner membrane protein
MDPISQGALGAALPQSLSQQASFRQRAATVTWVGALSGMAPDLDVFIRSSIDPLLFLEFHRQFTHSLFFIPLGALICAAVFARFSQRTLTFKQTYLVCLLGYGTHALLDACTSYGTQLLWPFSNYRFAWNNIAVVDPFATVPLLLGVIFTWRRADPRYVRYGLAWFLIYLGLGFAQQQRAASAAAELANSRDHNGVEIAIKPGFANILLWKSIYIHEGIYYVDAIRTGVAVTAYEGASVAKFDVRRDLPWLDPHSQQGIDVERFRWFSKDYLAMDPIRPNFVIDMRYSMIPNEVNSLWGIGLTPGAATTAHVTFESDRDASPERLASFWAMLRGDTCIPAASGRDSTQPICAIRL